MKYFKTGETVLKIIKFFELNPNSTALEASHALRIDRFKVRSVINCYLTCFDSKKITGILSKRYTLKPNYKKLLADKGFIYEYQ